MARTEAPATVAHHVVVVVEGREVWWTRQAQSRSETFYAFLGLRIPLVEIADKRQFMAVVAFKQMKLGSSRGYSLRRVHFTSNVVLKLDASW